MKPVLAAFAIAIAATASLAPLAAPSAAERSPEFKGYRTYSWVFAAPPAAVDPSRYEIVKASIARQLAGKGYVEAERSDMAVAFTIGRRDRIAKTDWGAFGGDIYTRLGVVPVTGADDAERLVTEGTLAIDIYDAASKRPVWRATAAKELPPSGASQRMIDQAVREAMKPLPGARR